MFDRLDNTLSALLNDELMPAALAGLLNAEVSFVTPDRLHAPGRATVNLFLYETRENRELRDPVPIVVPGNGLSLRRLPPLRVDCFYMVTAWSDDIGADKVSAEHRLLAEAFNWLSRFPVIPQRFLDAGTLTGQVYAPPTLVAQMDTFKNASEFWVSLGIPPRPFFNLVVTVTMDLDQALEEFPVTAVMTDYRQQGSGGSDRRAAIGGTVRDRNNVVVRDAWVRIDPAGFTTVTDAAGRFVFDSVAAGSGATLRARAPGFAEATLPNFDIPSINGRYDLTFS
ncbi:MAG: Pvc16 family protein [Pseudomonadota bacterium]